MENFNITIYKYEMRIICPYQCIPVYLYKTVPSVALSESQVTIRRRTLCSREGAVSGFSGGRTLGARAAPHPPAQDRQDLVRPGLR